MPHQRSGCDLLDRVVPAERLPRVTGNVDDYRATVAARFAEHRRVAIAGDLIVCTCGDQWPCPIEHLAARLLDWV
jgi:hypothetical protein